MSRVWLARTRARSKGSSGGAGRWVSVSSLSASLSALRGNPAPIPEAAGVVLSEAICKGERESLLVTIMLPNLHNPRVGPYEFRSSDCPHSLEWLYFS
jgi:hypothetical protein